MAGNHKSGNRSGTGKHASNTSFKPGASGNPGGRKKLTPALRTAREELRAGAPDAAARILNLVRSADERIALDAAKFVYEHTYGKAPQAVELTGAAGAPVETAVTVRGPTDGHLAAILAIMDGAGGLALAGAEGGAGAAGSLVAEPLDPARTDSTAGSLPTPRKP